MNRYIIYLEILVILTLDIYSANKAFSIVHFQLLFNYYILK